MATTTLTYTIAPYVPFTKILSANANQDKTDIQNRLNWAGGTSTTTGLGDDNIQSNTAATETQASLVTQGITLTAKPGFGTNGNSITITFTSGGTAGSESVTVSGTDITVQVASGVSTVTQVVTALNATTSVAKPLITASGASASTVSSASVLSLSGGANSTGLTRSSKLTLDSAGYVVINDSSGKMSSEQTLDSTRGGTGLRIIFSSYNPGDVLQINANSTGFTVGPSGGVTSGKIFSYINL